MQAFEASSVLWKPFKFCSLESDTFLGTYNPRHKSWNTCVIFPFPNVDLGITVI